MQRHFAIAATLAGGLLLQASAAAASAATWSVVSTPNASSNGYNVLIGVAAVSPTDAWAVGLSRIRSNTPAPFRPLLERWDGTSWRVAKSASLPATDDARLQAVTATSATDVWAVGQRTTGNQTHALIEHWDGTRWSVVAPPPSEPVGATLLGVAGSPGDVWAVGRTDTAGGTSSTLAEHWDGSRWSVTPTPGRSGLDHNALAGVVVLSSTDAWAVGRIGSQHPAPVIEHWDGATWTIHASPPTPFYGDLEGVAALSPSDIWAVGFQGVTATLTEHWNGTAWSVVASPNGAGSGQNSFLGSVVAFSPGDVWAAGSVITLGAQKTTLAEHWDGHRWSVVATPSPGPLETELTGLGGTAGGPLWAAGSKQSRNATTTLVLRTTA